MFGKGKQEPQEPRDWFDDGGSQLAWLQAWYMSNCDGDWEHSYGVSIDTLDNPGWSVRISLVGSWLSDRPFERVTVERAEHDWVHAWVEGDDFRIMCGPLNLSEGLWMFREWVRPDWMNQGNNGTT